MSNKYKNAKNKSHFKNKSPETPDFTTKTLPARSKTEPISPPKPQSKWELPEMLKPTFKDGVGEEQWLDLIYVMQLIKTKNFCHLRREVEDLLADFKLSRNTIFELKETVRKLRYDKETDRAELTLFKHENRKLIEEKVVLRSSFDEVVVKHEGVKIKYDVLKGDYINLNASYSDLKHDVGRMEGKVLDADGRLRKFVDSLDKKESLKVMVKSDGFKSDGFRVAEKVGILRVAGSDVKYDSVYRSQCDDRVGEYYQKYGQKYDAKYAEKYDEYFDGQFRRFPDQNNNASFTKPILTKLKPIYQDQIYSNVRSVEVRPSYLSHPSKRTRLNSRNGSRNENEHNEPEKPKRATPIQSIETKIYLKNAEKDTYAKKQRTERFSKDCKRNDLNELSFNSQMKAKKKATNWADHIDECNK